MRRAVARRQRKDNEYRWPILEEAGAPPIDWRGWPNQAQFAFITTHDVETQKGHSQCWQVAMAEKALGFRSSFNFVPERYIVDPELRIRLIEHGFEIGVHGLNHDGRLYASRNEFNRRAQKINRYIDEWGVTGFRSPAMHHNLEWISELNIDYDASTFDVDPFEIQPDGVNTIFPFWVKRDLASGNNSRSGYVELPYTIPQDHSVFIIFQEKNLDIWKRKLDWVANKGGMALLNTHPDYMSVDGKRPKGEEYPLEYYVEFLEFVQNEYGNACWHALPRDVAHYYKTEYIEGNSSRSAETSSHEKAVVPAGESTRTNNERLYRAA